MATPIKIRDMFLVPPGGGRVVLTPGAQHTMTRQGVVTTVPELPKLPELADGRPEALRAYNTNALTALGSRGDLRQLEALYGNLTNLYNNAVHESDVFHDDGLVGYEPESLQQLCSDGVVYDLGEPAPLIESIQAAATPSGVSFFGHVANSPEGPWISIANTSIYSNGAFSPIAGVVEAAIGQVYRYIRFTRHLSWPAGGVQVRYKRVLKLSRLTVHDMKEPVLFTRATARGGSNTFFEAAGSNSPDGPWTYLNGGLTGSVLGNYFWDAFSIDKSLLVNGPYRYIRVGENSTSGALLYYRRGSTRSPKFLTRADSARIAELIADPYNAHIFIEGGVPVGEDVLTLMIPSPVSLPANLVGSYLHCGVKPSAAFAITLYKNATSLGTLTINTSGGFAAAITATTFAKGDKLRMVPQAVGDTTLADLAMTLHMKRV